MSAASPRVLPFKELPHTVRQYCLLELIGAGAYGAVYKACNMQCQEVFAIKVVSIGEKTSAQLFYDAEVVALSCLDHPNIVRLYDHFKEDNLLFLVLEYCPNGTVSNLISHGKGVPKTTLTVLCQQIISAIGYCHSHGIAHRDLKPSNILLDAHGRPKLSDFGFSVKLIGPDAKVTSFCGSYPYAPPEVIRNEEYCPYCSDVWSLGVLLFQIATGRSLWPTENMDRLQASIQSGVILPINTGIKQLDKLISKMVVLNPALRISLQKVESKGYLSSRSCSRSNSGTSLSGAIPDLDVMKAASHDILKSPMAKAKCVNLASLPRLVFCHRRPKLCSADVMMSPISTFSMEDTDVSLCATAQKI